VREGWLADTSYADRVDHIVRVRQDPVASEPVPDLVGTTGAAGLVPWTVQARRRPGAWTAALPALAAAGLVAAVVLGLPPWWLLLTVPLALLGAALWGRSRVRAAAEHHVTLGLVAAAVADGLRGAGLSPVGHEALRVETTRDGTASFTLVSEDESVSATFATAFEEVLSPMSGPRYVLPRWVTSPPQGPDGLVRGLRAIAGRVADGEVWHTVPSVLAANRKRADAFADAWDHWVGGGRPVLASTPEGAGVLATHRGQDPFAVTCVIRRIWR